MKKFDYKFTSIYVIVMILIYISTRCFMDSLYTPKWVAINLFPYIFIFITILAASGLKRFVVTAVIGYISGIIAGELFGGFESHVGPQYLHWGWLIFIIVFIISCVIGYFCEKFKKYR